LLCFGGATLLQKCFHFAEAWITLRRLAWRTFSGGRRLLSEYSKARTDRYEKKRCDDHIKPSTPR
jgi:hypothetical protein